MFDFVKRLGEFRRILLIAAAGMLVVAAMVPMWQISLGAPQYPEGPLIVEMYLYPALSGDFAEVHGLNKYVGFYFPDPVFMEPNFPIHEKSIDVPEWILGPVVFGVLAATCLFVSVAPDDRRLKLGLICEAIGTSVVFVGMFVVAQFRLYQAGHSLDPDAPLRGVDGFTPPVLGNYEVANITGTAWFGPGGYLTMVAIGLLAIAVALRHSEATIADTPEILRDAVAGVARKLPFFGGRHGVATGSAETGFLVAAVAVSALLAGTPAIVGEPAADEPEEAFDLDVERDREVAAVPESPVATVDGETFESAQAAVDAADPGDVVELEGRFDERLVVETDRVTVRAADGGAVVDAGGTGRVVTIRGREVTLEGLRLQNSGYEVEGEDAGVFVAGAGAELRDLYLREINFGVWVDGVDEVTVADSRIEGRPEVRPITDRGNGIHLWETDGTVVTNNEITDVRDGIYYSWAEDVDAVGNAMWDCRYGVHYMYSSDNLLESNIAVDNDVGFALMVSDRLEIVDNMAIRNSGTSGHGIMVKEIEDSTIRDNVVSENDNGIYAYNAQSNRFERNLVLRNAVGVHITAGSSGQTVVDNSFINNDESVRTTTREVQIWTGEDRGNYWSDARALDLTRDGVSEVRHRPAGLVEHLIVERPQAAVFADSPAFDAVRLAESSFPVVEAPGVVDTRPLVEPPHEDWRKYANRR